MSEKYPALDETVVVAAPDAPIAREETAVDDFTVAVADETIVVNRFDASDQKHSSRHRPTQGESPVPAPPVDGPVRRPRLSALFGRGAGFDPQRAIAPVPGARPWDRQVTGARGVSQGIPVSYGTRVHAAAGVSTGIDEVQRRLGAAPQAKPVLVREGRDQLPSLHRLDQRRRVVTLTIYAGVVVACVLGLWGVATIAFGW